MLLLILRHVDTRHHRLVVEEIFSQCLGQLRLTDTRGAEEDEGGDRPLRVLQSCPRTAHGIADGGDGFVLSDDPLVELVFEAQQLLALTLHHACHGDARPAADHFGNVVGGDLLADATSRELRVED